MPPLANTSIIQFRLSCGYWSDRRSPLNYARAPTLESLAIEPR